MPRTLWSHHFSHTQSAVSSIILKAESKTEPKERQKPQRKLAFVKFPELPRWAQIVLIIILLSFPPGCRENSSLTLGPVLVLFFSLSFAFDQKQWCFEEQYLVQTRPHPMLPLLEMLEMLEMQALSGGRGKSSLGETEGRDSTHATPSAVCSPIFSPLAFSDTPAAAFSSRLVKCPTPLPGVQMQASAFQEPGKLSALESHPVNRRSRAKATATEGGKPKALTPNSARPSLMALAEQLIVLRWFPISAMGATGSHLPPVQVCCEVRMWEGGRCACTDRWNAEGVLSTIRA